MWGHVESCRSVEEIQGYKVGGLNIVKMGEWVPRTPFKQMGWPQGSHIPHSKLLEIYIIKIIVQYFTTQHTILKYSLGE